ncbi:MAG: zinc ABC transporter substrate-binding protein [Spirochaetota bacterium]
MNFRNISLIFILFILFGCADSKQNSRITVIATLFPQYDFAKQIVKDKADVRLLIPPGIEAHTYEPTPRDISEIRKAGVFIYTGEYMEPWSLKLIQTVKNNSLIIVDASAGIHLMDESEEPGHEHGKGNQSAEHERGTKDPHIWVDPVLAKRMAENVLVGLIKANPENESFYKANADSLIKELDRLNTEFTDLFKKVKYKTIIHGGHFTFGYFSKRYGLKYISPYSGFSPNAEPSPQKIAELIKTIKATGLKIIYYEELIDPKAARVISRQTGAKMLLLHGAHNVSGEEINTGVTYVSIMRGNLERLREGLN